MPERGFATLITARTGAARDVLTASQAALEQALETYRLHLATTGDDLIGAIDTQRATEVGEALVRGLDEQQTHLLAAGDHLLGTIEERTAVVRESLLRAGESLGDLIASRGSANSAAPMLC